MTALSTKVTGNTILAADHNEIYNLLKGIVGAGEAITLVYNAAGVISLQPSSDPAAGTEMIQVKNNAGTRQVALTSDGKVKFADGTTFSTASATLTSTSATLGADVAFGIINTYVDGPSIALTAGTWLITGSLYMDGSGAVNAFTVKLWDGTTVAASAETVGAVGGTGGTAKASVALSAVVTVVGTPTYKLSAANATSGSGNIKAAAVDNGAGNNASRIGAIKVA